MKKIVLAAVAAMFAALVCAAAPAAAQVTAETRAVELRTEVRELIVQIMGDQDAQCVPREETRAEQWFAYVCNVKYDLLLGELFILHEELRYDRLRDQPDYLMVVERGLNWFGQNYAELMAWLDKDLAEVNAAYEHERQFW